MDERIAPPEQCQIVGDVTLGFAVEAPYSHAETDLEKALLKAFERGD